MWNNEKGETSHEKTQYDSAVSIQTEEYAGREKTLNGMASIKLGRSINFYYIKLY